MSWGWTPLCRVGSERYRISTTTERPSPSVVLANAQCTYGSQLPPETSIVLTTPRQGTVSSQLPLSSVTTQISSDFNSQNPVENQSTSGTEERVVRRSPRIARTSRVSYRDDGESQTSRPRSEWSNQNQQEQTMWSNDRSQTNCNQQANKNYSVYNYDGQSHPLLNSSVSILYNHNKNLLNNVAQSRLPRPPTFTSKTGSIQTTTIRSPKKVTIKNLDFYEIVTSLLQEEIIHDGIGPLQRTFRFFLKPEDARSILDHKRKHPSMVQLRFCKLDGSCEQSDYYPVTHQVAVNHQLILLPGLETMPRGAMRPMDVTHFCQVNPQACNFITIRCVESCKMFLCVVQKYTSQDLLHRLEEKSPTKEEETTNEIKKKLQDDQADDGIASTTLQCSLACPLSRTRMKLPCRASTCNHLQCFDAATYIQMNECKPKWSCPVCYQPALYKNLQIDGYFKKIIEENASTDKVELHPDGSWTPVEASKKKPQQAVNTSVTEDQPSENRKSVDPADKTVTLDSDDDGSASASVPVNTPSATDTAPVVSSRRNYSPEIETIVLSDDDSPGGETPCVTASTYPTFNSTPIQSARNTENNDVTVESEQLAYPYDLWGTSISRLFSNSFPQLDQFRHSNSSLYIPLTRTSITPPQFNSNSITITRATNQPRSNSSDRLNRSTESTQGTPSKKKSSTPRVSKSKITKLRKERTKAKKKNTKLSSKQTKRKRRRIIVESSDSSDNLNSSKNTSSASIRKHTAKQKKQSKKRKKRVIDSSDEEQSSVSSNSKNSVPSVNVISSTDRSRSSSSCNSNSSSSSSESENEDSDSDSDKSFVSDAVVPPPESSRVLRSRNASLRQKRKKK